MKKLQLISILVGLLAAPLSVAADDYTTYLTTDRGFTEVTSTAGFTGNANDYYILTSAETTGLIVGIGAYEAKPDWASTESKALRYKSAATDPVLDLTNFFTIEKSGQYIGLRNVVYNTDLFQTHDNAGYMYVNTFTDPNLDEWSYLTPTYQNGYWLFESGKYPISSGNWACGFLGPWNNRVEDGQPMALNRRNTEGDEAGHYHLFRITKANLDKLRSNTSWDEIAPNASDSNPIDATRFITNPSFETGNETGWTQIGKDPNGNDEFKVRDYGMTNKDGAFLMNAFQWWAPSLGVTQTVTEVPSGKYTLSGVVATWEGRTVTFTGNDVTVATNGQGDGTGIPVSVNLTIGMDSKLTISAGSTGQWWVEGHEGETQTFFKLDNVRLTCKGVFLNGFAKPLPNDDATLLTAITVNSWQVLADDQLKGTVIGTAEAVDYSTNSKSTTVNTCENAFDGDFETFFASYDRSYTWAGLDLGSPHVITRVGWAPRNDSNGPARVVLGVFEGANSPDFMDALPLYLIDEKGTIGKMSYADVSCSRGFRYVRYVGPSDSRCNLAELAFYGHAGEGDDSHLYQITNLPTVSIHTLNGEIPYDKEHQIVSQLTIISDNGTKLLSEPGTTNKIR